MRGAVFPDTEAVAATWLRTRNLGATVATDLIGFTKGQRRIVVVRTGGTPTLPYRIDNPRLDIDAWGASKSDAHDLAQAARAALHELPTGNHTALAAVVAHVEDESGLTWLPDPETGAARYVFSLRLAVHPYP